MKVLQKSVVLKFTSPTKKVSNSQIVKWVSFCLFISVAIASCKKEQIEMNPIDLKCECAKEVSADFLMEEMTTFNPNFVKYTNTDTIFKNKNVRFSSVEKGAQYTWYIGTEIITDSIITRYFNDTWSYQDLPITLVVKKKPNKICFPNDDGYDSITKMLYVSEYPIDTQFLSIDLGSIEGNYRVKSDHLLDSFDIAFDVDYDGLGVQTFNIYNYDGLGSNCVNQAIVDGGNYRQVWALGGTSGSQCDYLRGSVHNGINGVAEFKLSFGAGSPNNPNYYTRTYLGRKI